MKTKKTIAIVNILFAAMFLFSSCSFKDYLKKAVLGNMPFVKRFIQKDFNTYTSITGIKDKMQLVTAKQQIDFINIMDGKDGRYLEVSTFEVKAGIDFEKIKTIKTDKERKIIYPSVEILSSDKINSVAPRENSDNQFYENSIKPVNIAYTQKAKDYAVELGLLENAKKGAEKTLKNLINATVDLNIDNYKENYEIKYLPFTLDIEKEYFEKHNMKIIPVGTDKFYRDSFLVGPKGNDNWLIRIGDTGRTFFGTFEDFYQNVFKTNSSEENSLNDRVEIFRYFDPMYPKECEILGYASDSFRTMFLINNGRIYYVDAEVNNEQTLINDISPTMVYLASSMRKINDRKVELYDEYKNYISTFFDAQEALRTNSSRVAVRNVADKLAQSNVLNENKADFSLDEKYFLSAADVKCLGRTETQNSVIKTGDSEFDELTELIKDLLVSKDNFSTDETREDAIRVATSLDVKIYKEKNKKGANTQYLETWFVQNTNKFNLSPETRKKYEGDLKSETLIASRPMIAIMDDSERNEYFYNLFRNRLATAHFFVDTASVVDDNLKKSVRGSNMFVYYNLPEFKESADGDIYENIKKQNLGRDIDNSFIFVFNQIEWNWGSWQDNDIHAIVLDDSTLRFFPNVGTLTIEEKAFNIIANVAFANIAIAVKVIDGMRGKYNAPVYFYYGDWKNLRISPENVSIAGHSFATKKITKKGKKAYRNSNDYAEKSVIASVIEDLQHAYSNDDADYYFDVLCENLDYQIQRYVYEKIFRPSPRMILDTREDAQKRYNK